MSDVILMGPPGTGKGTQAQQLVAAGGWVQLSTGDLFRQSIADGTALGTLAKGYMDRGEYVPDDVTVAMVREWVEGIPASTRILFDGFPRTVAQADALDVMLSKVGRQIGAAVLLDAPRDEILKRLHGRAVAQGRSDDAPEVITRRFDVYAQQTAPLVDHYDRKSLLRRVSGLGSVEEVAARMRGALATGGKAAA